MKKPKQTKKRIRTQTRMWDVELGDNFMTLTVIAKDYIEAGQKALDWIEELDPVGYGEDYVRKVELARTADC